MTASAAARPLVFLAVFACVSSCGDPEDDAPPPRPFDDVLARSADGRAATGRAASVGTTACTLDGIVNPHGLPTEYWFEYGPTPAYGTKTPARRLPGKLAAHYRETFDSGVANWNAGPGGTELAARREGATTFVRFDEPSGTDQNHADGIGANHLVSYAWVGTYDPGVAATARWGGGDPDLRGGKLSVSLRGNDWQARDSELAFWMQSDLDLATQSDDNVARRANWAYTGQLFTEALAPGGGFRRVDVRLRNQSAAWTYAGHRVGSGRDTYQYQGLDASLAHVNNDVFLMLVFVSPIATPQGSIDVDEIEVTYRNHSLLFAGNGARVAASPPGSADPARLTDGWRNGLDRTWTSAPSPTAPQEITWELERPVTIERLQIHNDPDWPSKDVEVLVSSDGNTWTLLARRTLPDKSPGGPNFLFFVDDPERRRGEEIDNKPTTPFPLVLATRVKVRVLSGYRAETWGLGEVEAFGTGALESTDDEDYDVVEDIAGIAAGATIHYRLVASNAAGIAFAGDKTYEAPTGERAMVFTRDATRIAHGSARLEARVAPLGRPAYVGFQWGETDKYGLATTRGYAGTEASERTYAVVIAGLKPGTLYHYRAVGRTDGLAIVGEDRTFVAE